jgi:hypothetical protein
VHQRWCIWWHISRSHHNTTYFQIVGIKEFVKCTSLLSIKIAATVSGIGSWAFDGCGRLRGVVAHERITHIGTGAFIDCGSLELFRFPALSSHLVKYEVLVMCGEVMMSCSSLLPQWNTAIIGRTSEKFSAESTS